MLEIVGILAVIALVVTLFIRPSGVLPVLLAVGVVGAAIIVSWNDIEQTRAQRAANAVSSQENSSAAATVPPSNATHAGS
jgi:hypothetical protein